MPERDVYETRPARAGEAALLRPLWQECFGDGEAFARLYEQTMFRPDRVELALLGGEAAAMLTVLPAVLCRGGETFPGGCVYGVATLPAHRGGGLAAALLAAARTRLGRTMDVLAVVPDTTDLFPYYGRTLGAKTAFFVRETRVTAAALGEGPGLEPAPAEAADYLAVRRLALQNRTFLDWDLEAIQFQQGICRMEGGGLFLFPGAPGCCAAAERGEGGLLLVRELLAPEELLAPCLGGLLAAFGCREAEVRLPAWSGERLGGRAVPFAMAAGPDFPEAELAYLGFDFA